MADKTALLKPGAKTDWETPDEVFEYYDDMALELFGERLQLDVCATEENTKCRDWFYDTPEASGLLNVWDRPFWCNPPYGRGIGAWVKKAMDSLAPGMMLLPVRTDTRWFHDYLNDAPSVRLEFIKGRITFVGAPAPAPFPSMVVVFL